MLLYSSDRLAVRLRGNQLHYRTRLMHPEYHDAGGLEKFRSWLRYLGYPEQTFLDVQAALREAQRRRAVAAEQLGQPGDRYHVLLAERGARRRRRGVWVTLVQDTERFRYGVTDRGTPLIELRTPQLSAPFILTSMEQVERLPEWVTSDPVFMLHVRGLLRYR